MTPLIISHRCNLNGPDPKTENTIEAIQKCIQARVDIELDIWYTNGKFFLGHEGPTTEFNPFIFDFGDSRIWFHCKSIETMDILYKQHFHFWEGQNWGNQYRLFFHDKDDMTLTSNQEFWTYPGRKLYSNSIAVMPEYQNYEYRSYVSKLFLEEKIKGICSDFPLDWRESDKEKVK